MLTLDSRVVAHERIMAADVNDRVVLMDVDAGKYFDFEATAGDIWRGIASPRRIGDLCDELLRTYDAPRERVERASLAFLDTLLERRLIKIAA